LNASPSRTTIILVLVCGIVAVSFASIFIKYAQNAGATSIVIATFRLTLASLVLAPIAIMRYRAQLKSLARHEWLLAFLSGGFLAVHFVVWVTSLQYTSVASSVVLVTTTPLWVAMLAPLFLHEHVSPAVYFGLILALLGGTVVGLSDTCTWQSFRLSCPVGFSAFSSSAFLGDFLALVGAWMAAGYMLVGRKLRKRMDLIPYIFIVYGMAAILLLIVMFATQQTFLGLPTIAYLWLVLLALVPQLLGHSIFNWSLRFIPVSLVSVTLLGEPVGSTILAYLLLQQQPGWFKMVGVILILVGIWLSSRITIDRV
jgi:drug/metabolite transporter (DMT)-like permease